MEKYYTSIRVRQIDNGYFVIANYTMGVQPNVVHDIEEYSFANPDDAVKKMGELLKKFAKKKTN